MENISLFLNACRSYGVSDISCFQTVDLYENKQPYKVVECLRSLTAVVRFNSHFCRGFPQAFTENPLFFMDFFLNFPSLILVDFLLAFVSNFLKFTNFPKFLLFFMGVFSKFLISKKIFSLNSKKFLGTKQTIPWPVSRRHQFPSVGGETVRPGPEEFPPRSDAPR